MATVLTALEAHQKVEAFAKEAPTDVRVIPDGQFPVGKWARQGDIYLLSIEKVPVECDQETANRQLAPGEGRGSRHIVAGNVKLFTRKVPRDVLEGPVMVVKPSERAVVEHPEHAHISVPAGTYQVYYQMDARQAERTRALD